MQLMKTLVITLITALCALFFMRAAPAEVVYIWDEDLRAAILKKLNKPNPKAAITTSDMLRLTELRLEEVDFFTLTGLEHATNLTTLYLSWGYRSASQGERQLPLGCISARKLDTTENTGFEPQ